jgi:hypothetical protein
MVSLAALALALLATSNGAAAVVIPAAGATTVVSGGDVVIDPVVWWADMGEYFGNGRAYVVPLQLPTLPPGMLFGDADLAFGQHGPGMHPDGLRSGFYGASAPTYNIDLYGLHRIANTGDVLANDHYSGPADPAASLLQDAFLHPDSPGNRAVIHTTPDGSTALTDWLNAAYADGANAGKFVFLRLSPDGPEGSLPWSGYQVMTALAGGAEEKPALTYSIVPEPATLGLLALGAGLLRRRR